MGSFPFPLRIAVGVAVSTVEQARELPQRLVGLPITAVSQAIQFSFRTQQCLTELAAKGDAALSALRPLEDTPEWATFDEDDEPTRTTQAERPAEKSSADRASKADATPSSPDYDQLTLPQLRTRLRRLSAPIVVELLNYERAHANRAAFLSVLSRRLNMPHTTSASEPAADGHSPRPDRDKTTP